MHTYACKYRTLHLCAKPLQRMSIQKLNINITDLTWDNLLIHGLAWCLIIAEYTSQYAGIVEAAALTPVHSLALALHCRQSVKQRPTAKRSGSPCCRQTRVNQKVPLRFGIQVQEVIHLCHQQKQGGIRKIVDIQWTRVCSAPRSQFPLFPSVTIPLIILSLPFFVFLVRGLTPARANLTMPCLHEKDIVLASLVQATGTSRTAMQFRQSSTLWGETTVGRKLWITYQL